MPPSLERRDAAPDAPDAGRIAQLCFVLQRDNGPDRQFDLAGDVTVIGRRADCDLRIPLGDVSRRHCAIHLAGNRVRLQDLGSSNGTFVNDRRVQESPLLAGDRVTIGRLTFLVRIDGKPEQRRNETSAERTGAALAEAAGLFAAGETVHHLNPTAQSDAADAGGDPDSHHGLDPSGAAGDLEDLMSD